MKFTAVILLALLSVFSAKAQQDTSTRLKFEISIPPAYNLAGYATDAARLQALMAANPAAGQALSGLNIQSFHPLYPGSHYQYLRNIYELTCANEPANESAILSLRNSDPVSFQYVKRTPVIANLGTYTPNDYHGPPGYDCSAQLDFINATTAWAITKGNPAVTIGINDPSGFDVHNPDLVGKIIGVDSTNVANFHGTAVAGCAAAHTDNGIGVAAIGFNCTLYLNHLGGDAQGLDMSSKGIKIINNSWFYGFDCSETYQPEAFVGDELVYDEIYENGTTTCFAAGNGLSGYGHCESIFGYAYPGSLDHIITVGPVGYQNPLGVMADWDPAHFPPGGIPWLWKYCHEESPGNAIGQFVTLNYQANSRVDICAPAYNVVSTGWAAYDTSAHYVSAACGTSFASPIVAGALGLLLSANGCLSPYQLEYLLKTNAHSMDYIEYPPGSGINVNANYVGKMGAGALDAGAAVTAASTFNCNDTATQTMVIKGIELNTICAPGYSANGIKPTFYPVIERGTPPFTYRWDAMPGNNTILDDYTSANPTVLSGTFAQYRLGVYDNSPVQKEASKIIQVNLTAEQTPLLTIRDGYMDMLNEPNMQADVDGYDWQLTRSPDIANRLADDHVFSNQNPVYAPGVLNYANARVSNVGCVASAGTEQLDLYWTKSSTGASWPADWTTAKFTNASTGATSAAGGLITATPVTIAPVQPGGEALLSAPWYPPNPVLYDPSVNTVDINLLARIETSTNAPYGMTVPEVVNTSTNVANNNKVATLNVVVNNPAGGAIQWHQVLLANTENYDRQFTLEFGSDKDFHPSLGGDISAYANVQIELGALYDRWVASGAQGTNVLVDGKTKSVLFTGNGKIVLRGITIHANEKVPALVGVFLKQQPVTDHHFNIRQLVDTVGNESSLSYGDISLVIPGCANDTGCVAISNPNTNGVSLATRVNVFPNPTQHLLTVLYAGYDENTLSFTISDLSGKKLLQQSGVNVVFGTESGLDISILSDGVYILRITDKDNNHTAVKIVKD